MNRVSLVARLINRMAAMNWYVNSFRCKRVATQFPKSQLQKTGLIVIHYSGASLIRDYKGTKYYLAGESRNTTSKKIGRLQ